jgi:hypothetical protein
MAGGTSGFGKKTFHTLMEEDDSGANRSMLLLTLSSTNPTMSKNFVL